MIKILTVDQIRAWDNFTIEEKSISSIDLMESAAQAFVDEILKKLKIGTQLDVVCGPGNNGGDGFAIARILTEKGFNVNCFLIDFGAKLSDDCHENYIRVQKLGRATIVKDTKSLKLTGDVVIDALLGSGLNRPASGLAAEVIQLINQYKSKKVSVDVPSGLFADDIDLSGEVIKADWTITFQVPKLSFLIPESGFYVGEWTAVDIGLTPDFLQTIITEHYLLELGDIDINLFRRSKYGHKGNYGKVLIVAGSLGKMGAAYFSSKAALKAGSGLVTAHIPKVGYTAMQSLLPEAMAILDQNENCITRLTTLEGFDVVGVGPGLGQDTRTVAMLKDLLTSFDKPIVIDADALNLIASNKHLIELIPKGSVLTPHVGEFNRLFGEKDHGLERIECIKAFAVERQVIVILKGAHTVIASPDGKLYFNSTGNAGMATGGCGDVLTGIISAFLGQGMDCVTAARNAVYIHGLAGDLAENKVGKTSLMASDLLCALSKSFSNVENNDFI